MYQIRFSLKQIKFKIFVTQIKHNRARWDKKTHRIADPYPKELFSDLPLMHLRPILMKEGVSDSIYDCPLYKVVSRRGTLSTTGHSTNFVMFIELETNEKEDKWIVGGLAAFLALRY